MEETLQNQQEPNQLGAMPSGHPRREQLIKLVGAIGSLGLFLLAFTYILGYVIWNSYLAKFGIHIQDFLRPEYLAAAICYMLFVLVLAVPMFFILFYIFAKGKFGIGKLSWGIFILWYYLTNQFETFFSINVVADFKLWPINFVTILLSVGLLHICLAIFLTVRGKLDNLKPDAVKNIFFSSNTVWLYNLVLLFHDLFMSSKVDGDFLVSCLLLGGVVGYFLLGLKEGAQSHRVVLYTLIFTAITLIILNNAKSFGEKQFALIPQQQGGGLPEKTQILPSPTGIAVLSKLGVRIDSTGWSSPIWVLAKTEREIFFVTRFEKTSNAKSLKISYVDGLNYIIEK